MSHWWERLPDRLEYELDELSKAGIPFEKDEGAIQSGVMKLTVRPVVGVRSLRLVVTFPDRYPYFRFEVEAPDEDLPHHQHPFQKNLCLMGRDTYNWSTDDTVAGIISTQLPKVLETGRSGDRDAVIGQEQEQAEPYSDYYPYAESSILIDGSWSIPRAETCGSLIIRLPADAKITYPLFLRAAVIEIRGSQGKVLATADRHLAIAYSGPRLTGRWVRADKPIPLINPKEFFQYVQKLDSARPHDEPTPLGDGTMQVYGVVFPEEVGWRTSGDGWVFVCHQEWVNRAVAGGNTIMTRGIRRKVGRGHAGQAKGGTYFARAGRAGPVDLMARIPSSAPLGSKKVAIFGLGCLGAPSAFELARAGVGELRVLDSDIVDPGTVCRWPVGLSAAGRRKVDVVRDIIAKDYPYSRLVPVLHRLGTVRFNPNHPGEESDDQVVSRMTHGADLIYDATAEIGVQYFLSDTAAGLRIPYISVAGTYGGWGGTVVRLIPGQTEGCWLCYRYACEDGTIPLPPEDPSGRVQPAGCANPTYIGPGFDLSQIALTAVRAAVATLSRTAPNDYPDFDWDVMIVSLRDTNGIQIAPRFDTYKLTKHPNCPRCNP